MQNCKMDPVETGEQRIASDVIAQKIVYTQMMSEDASSSTSTNKLRTMTSWVRTRPETSRKPNAPMFQRLYYFQEVNLS